MNKKDLQALAQEATLSIKTGADLTEFRQMLTKVTVEAALATDEDDTGAPRLSQFDARPTVSEGGYAALFLYSKLVEDARAGPRSIFLTAFQRRITTKMQPKFQFSKTNWLRNPVS